MESRNSARPPDRTYGQGAGDSTRGIPSEGPETPGPSRLLCDALATSLPRVGTAGVWHGAAEKRVTSVTLQMFAPEMVCKKHTAWKENQFDFENF